MAFMGIWAIPVPASSQPPRVRCLREDGRCLYVGTRLHRFRWHSVTLRSLYCRSYLIRSPRPKEKTWIFLVKCKPSFQVVTPGALWGRFQRLRSMGGIAKPRPESWFLHLRLRKCGLDSSSPLWSPFFLPLYWRSMHSCLPNLLTAHVFRYPPGVLSAWVFWLDDNVFVCNSFSLCYLVAMGPWPSLQSSPCLHFLLHIRKVTRLPITQLLRGLVGWERSAQCVAQ